MNKNSENPKVGKEFQQRVLKIAEEHFGKKFSEEIPLLIGNPSKEHKFDVVSEDKTIVIECKCYTWTKDGNVPSAKMSTLNGAVFYMSNLPTSKTKIIVMKKDMRSKKGKNESLATYYCRTYGHLLEGIQIYEVDESNKLYSLSDMIQ